MNLLEFIARVDERIDKAVSRPEFEPEQRELLEKTVMAYRRQANDNPVFDPLSRSVIYFIVKAWGRPIGDQVEYLATFTSLYLLSADLMDDVEDEDLAGKPHESVGPAVAINNAVTLLFLALDALQSAIELESCAARRQAFQRVFNRVSVIAVAGQHRDLTGKRGVLSPRDVLRMQQAKTSSLSMITECAALLAYRDAEQCLRYRRFGECLASLVQIRDDLRDLFGVPISPDLALSRATYPIACFLDTAGEPEKRRFDELVRDLPATMHDVRTLLHEQGAVANCAETMEALRQEMHELIAGTNNCTAAHRVLLWVVDGLAESIYRTTTIDVSNPIFEPSSPWHRQIRDRFGEAIARTVGADFTLRPVLRPWHHPFGMYVPAQQTIYYPDVEGLPEEVLPFQAHLLGIEDLGLVANWVRAQVPAVLVHEMFHALRHVSGRMTDDYWHEEWAANRLAVAYLKRFEPQVLEAALEFVRRVLSCHHTLIDDNARQVLRDCHRSRSEAPMGYAMDLTSMAVVGLEMVRRLAAEPIDFDAAMAELLTSPASKAGEVAA